MGGGRGRATGGSRPHSLGAMADLRLSYRRALARVRLVARTVDRAGPAHHGSGGGQLGPSPGRWPGAAASRRRPVGRRADARSPRASRCPTPPGPASLFEQAELEVRFLAADVVRLSWGPGPAPRALRRRRRRALARARRGHRAPGRRAGSLLRSADLVVTVDGEGSVRILRPDGTVLRTEAPPVRHGDRVGSCATACGRASASAGWASSRPVSICAAGASSCGTPTPAVRGARVRGLSTWGSPWSWPPIPTGTPSPSTRTRPAASSPSATRTDPSRRPVRPSAVAGTASVSFAGGVLRHYVMVGDVAHLLDRYTRAHRPSGPAAAVGPRLPPEPMGVQDRSRTCAPSSPATGASDLPLSAVHLDIDYMDGYRVFTFDRSRFPDPGRAGVGGGGVRGAPGDDRRPRREGGRRLRPLPPGSRATARFCVDDTGRPGRRAWCGPDGWPSPTSPTRGPGRGGPGSTASSPTPVSPGSGTT